MGAVIMLARLQRTNTGWMEFLIKFAIVIFIIMPACILGSFWAGWRLDSLLNIHILKIIFPIAGSVLGLFFTALLILAGHARDSAIGVIEDLKMQSLCDPAQKQIRSGKSARKASPSRPGYLTAFQDN